MNALLLLLWLLCAFLVTKLIDWLHGWFARKATPEVWPVGKLKR